MKIYNGSQTMKLSDIAANISLDFNTADVEISALNALFEAGATELSFVSNASILQKLGRCKAGAVLLKPEWQSHCPPGVIALPVANPALTMALA